jgi:hypothetical protein
MEVGVVEQQSIEAVGLSICRRGDPVELKAAAAYRALKRTMMMCSISLILVDIFEIGG